MHRLQRELRGKVELLSVYILEAHAQDEWPLGQKVCVNQHKNIDERLAVANDFVERSAYQVPVLVDTMANLFNEEFAAWPERYFIIEKDAEGTYRCSHVGMPTTEFGYDRDQLEGWLRNKVEQLGRSAAEQGHN